ncbi:phospho-N-acetylmuramoyl-pentapeptide-transferase [Mycobacterium sp. 050134]|uniref:phospho-N-acetylmuramoyl-pentapeptide- transferase n=1 Tax=Mycobacterium sp. 050134 TaxID=3096111 RepID=UPI002EDB37C7
MKSILVAAGIAVVVAALLTPVLFRTFSRLGLGQPIRAEAPKSHQRKQGTPTMGGLAIVAAIWVSYLTSTLFDELALGGEGPTASGLLVLGLATALGVVGFTDDYLKVRRGRNLGLNKRAKSAGQLVAAILFGVLALQFRSADGLTPGSPALSYVRDIAAFALPPVVFVLFCIMVVSAWSNAVNLTDGLDGLAAGAMAMVAAAYVIITFWQFRNQCAEAATPGCYHVRDPLDLALVAAATAGACIGFLWWNAAPAKIIMGDTGSLALGGIIAGLSVTSRTEILAIILGALFVAEVGSVVIQVISFRTTGRRVFRNSPLHHHFELMDWPETALTIRFWLIAAISCGLGIALFYSEWLTAAGI